VAEVDEARANPDVFASRRTMVVPPELSAPVAAPRALAGTCSVGTTLVSLSAGNWGLNCPSCSSGVMVSCGFLPFSTDASLTAMFPSSPPTGWSIDLHLGSATSVELFGLCCQ
jgi:hypothetical protein